MLDDPAALQRLKEGRAVIVGDRGGIVREVVRRSEKPVVSRFLFGLNVAWFLYSLYLASRRRGCSRLSFRRPSPASSAPLDEMSCPVRAPCRGISGCKGQWWRLATSCFVHIGLLHIGLNMNSLLQAGKVVEQMWGRVRFLVIYALAGLGGGCLARGEAAARSTGWRVGRHCAASSRRKPFGCCATAAILPRSLAARWRGNLMTNGILIVVISLIPGVSGWCHLGGAMTGAAVALVMQVQRFGPSPLRWAVLLALVPLPWAGYALSNTSKRQTQNGRKWPAGGSTTRTTKKK